ncbi:MAG: hypothetical protein RL488_268 [Actinomycetota bacterium]
MLVVTLAFIELSTRKNRKRGKGRKAMGAGLFAIDEIFHPSAHESSIVLEEKREERKALPSPEDKELNSK